MAGANPIEREIPLDQFPSPDELWQRYSTSKGYTPRQQAVATYDYYDYSSGKSNLMEAILHLLLDMYLGKSTSFDLSFEYEAQGRQIALSSADCRPQTIVDGKRVSISHMKRRLRGGGDQVYFPESTFAYCSGECHVSGKYLVDMPSVFVNSFESLSAMISVHYVCS